MHAEQSGKPHTLYDLRHGTRQVYESGTIQVTAEMAQGTVYRLVPGWPHSIYLPLLMAD